ncbi:hypothetical protein L596_010397 [Steinernema carpocapsae]|uniref:Reverse transcriptase domain-containing protein n=4 Tax=Steinernema carpocapsae TaxID=34508 RepID=A0A4U5PIS0_STECR|nr:hypothetical protein L596_020986 [Steinernema carpocapsae]TKR79979.1 hypothetical protein L596_014119 [Steinernema carpocapsae]TKR88186.1 hypothetical protein L596_012471 [Steinernema carpocapsae]TKR96366.1 hypothetical protein L596_010397 [Steinernema carpocapsae]
MFHPPHRIEVGTLNVRRLATPGRLLELQEDLKPTSLDVVALTELGWKQCGALELQDSDFIFFHAGPQAANDPPGTGFMVHKRLKNKIHGFHQVAPRISRLDLKLRDQGLRLIAAYAPPTGSSRSRGRARTEDAGTAEENDEEAFEEFLEALREELQAEPSTFTILLGDFNAVIGSRSEEAEEETAVGPHGHGERNRRGQLLVEFCEEFRLRSVASLFKARQGRKWTHAAPNGLKSCIDYILAPRTVCFKKATVMSSHNAGSDHRLLRATIQDQARPEGRRPIPRPNAKKQIDKDLFRMAVAMNPPKPPADDASGYQDLVHCLQEAATFAEEEVRPRERLQPETRRLLQQRHRLRRLQHSNNARAALRELNKVIRKRMKADIDEHHRRLVEEAVQKGSGLRRIQGETATGRPRLTQLRNAEGRLCNTEEEMQRAVQVFYNNLYASRIQVEGDATPEEEEDDYPAFLQAEIEEAMRQMKTGRSPGQDRVTTEMLKLAKSRILPQLTAILNQCLRNGEVPAEMADSRTILLFKKGDHLDLKNYRPISLLPTIYKVLSRVISARIDRTLDEAQPIEQAGFRKNCSTAEHLQAVNQLLEKAREYRVPIFMVFIDFEKAFDSVESNAIWNAAQRQGVHPKLLKLLRNIYSQATSKIQVGRAQVQIEIQRGVRQGDTISPKLFNAALEETFKELRWEDRGLNINGRRISNLRFADDIVLIADTEEELQLMVTELQEASRRSGLKINRQKTKAMAAEEINILLDGEAIQQVTSFVYLGQAIQVRRDPCKEIGRRISSGWNAFRKYGPFLTSRSVQMRWKRRLFNQCILPALLYGCESWALTQAARKKLAVAQRRMERRMAGVRLIDRRSNDWLRGVTKIKDVTDTAARRKWSFAWKMANASADKWPKRIEAWRPPTTRPQGRPATRWTDDFAKKLGSKNWQRSARRETHSTWCNRGCDNV